MSLNDAPMSNDASGSIEIKEGKQNVTMEEGNAHAGSEFDAPGASEQDTLQHIQTITTYLSSVQEEWDCTMHVPMRSTQLKHY